MDAPDPMVFLRQVLGVRVFADADHRVSWRCEIVGPAATVVVVNVMAVAGGVAVVRGAGAAPDSRLGRLHGTFPGVRDAPFVKDSVCYAVVLVRGLLKQLDDGLLPRPALVRATAAAVSLARIPAAVAPARVAVAAALDHVDAAQTLARAVPLVHAAAAVVAGAIDAGVAGVVCSDPWNHQRPRARCCPLKTGQKRANPRRKEKSLAGPDDDGHYGLADLGRRSSWREDSPEGGDEVREVGVEIGGEGRSAG